MYYYSKSTDVRNVVQEKESFQSLNIHSGSIFLPLEQAVRDLSEIKSVCSARRCGAGGRGPVSSTRSAAYSHDCGQLDNHMSGLTQHNEDTSEDCSSGGTQPSLKTPHTSYFSAYSYRCTKHEGVQNTLVLLFAAPATAWPTKHINTTRAEQSKETSFNAVNVISLM